MPVRPPRSTAFRRESGAFYSATARRNQRCAFGQRDQQGQQNVENDELQEKRRVVPNQPQLQVQALPQAGVDVSVEPDPPRQEKRTRGANPDPLPPRRQCGERAHAKARADPEQQARSALMNLRRDGLEGHRRLKGHEHVAGRGIALVPKLREVKHLRRVVGGAIERWNDHPQQPARPRGCDQHQRNTRQAQSPHRCAASSRRALLRSSWSSCSRRCSIETQQ